ncbi:aspartyl-phosphate phosphatase Spo0E family protein [Lentibacillus cibarius]|nr:aspartyl-phosphate phosphatase Spo0E family protein [Lentibacillus cibarius]
MDNNSKLKEIEKYRNEMIRTGDKYGLTSPVAIQSSQRLDELLNSYQNA